MNEYTKVDVHAWSYSEQERKQQQTEDYVARNYFRKSEETNLQDVSVKLSLTEEFPHVKDHFLIIAKSVNGFAELVKPLRAKYLGRCYPIVILCPYEISDKEWSKINRFESVYFVRGSGLDENDIGRAGIYKAARVVVLAETSKNTDNIISSESLVDADAIFIYQFVSRMNRRTKMLIEIVNPANVSYLDTQKG